MEHRGQAKDRHGRTWTATVLSEAEAEEADFRFWYEGLSAEDRVRAVEDCLLSSLKAKGIHEIPRLRRVARVLQVPWVSAEAIASSEPSRRRTLQQLAERFGTLDDFMSQDDLRKMREEP